ncbi:TetR/AcrR family transcriptional regulator [Bradyrhizobium erythrophlei]|uniref:Transcriptional regulator, TetR family n=1 Tax=Bradyrhizobium erythrophlei TaxID=1437360 RepID=A0A1M5U509_9BRAD|nr:TetR/AcrR family transcriptional regulator [Bradyrhizobium erythrophlei]SHH57946.1 transcriptional regulator, TetR family [Bradyrhizobium erythrophlei]
MTPKIITGKKGEGGKRGRGRPAAFDRAVALQAAMKLFWERGYEGTSFDELIAAMGVSASSFYNSFGSKEALYCEATRSYLEWSGQWFFAILNDPSIDTKTAFARLFEATAEEFTRGDHPLGCMISLAGTHCPPGMSNIRDMMAEHRAFSESAMAARIRKGVANGEVPEDADCDMLAAYCSAVARGLAVQARDGASREKLAQIGRLAMSAWPAGKSGRSRLSGNAFSDGA